LRRFALSFGLKVGAGDAAQIAGQLLHLDQPIDLGMDQRIVADVIELSLHLLAIVRRHQRELLVQLAERRQDAFVEFADDVGVQDDLPARLERDGDELVFVAQLLDDLQA